MKGPAPRGSIFIDPDRGLVIPERAPRAIVLLAEDLYRYGQPDRPSKRRPRNSCASTTLVFSEKPAPHHAKGNSTSGWKAILAMTFDELSEETIARVNEYLADESAEHPAALPAAWGLYLLSRAIDEARSENEIVDLIAMAGRCAGLAALANGATRASRRASKKRWDPLHEIEADIRRRWQDQRGNYRSKAAFIREVAPEVLRRSQAIKGPLTESSTPDRIRKWLSK